MLRVTIIVCGILLGLLLAAIIVASSQANVLEGLKGVLAEPWGVVTLLDLSIGLLFIAAWIAVIEPRPLYSVVWILALLILGNVVTLIFLLWRTRNAKSFFDLFLPSRRHI